MAQGSDNGTRPDLPLIGGEAPFEDGWLDEQLARVAQELASLPAEQRPRLTGARAANLADPAWLRHVNR